MGLSRATYIGPWIKVDKKLYYSKLIHTLDDIPYNDDIFSNYWSCIDSLLDDKYIYLVPNKDGVGVFINDSDYIIPITDLLKTIFSPSFHCGMFGAPDLVRISTQDCLNNTYVLTGFNFINNFLDLPIKELYSFRNDRLIAGNGLISWDS